MCERLKGHGSHANGQALAAAAGATVTLNICRSLVTIKGVHKWLMRGCGLMAMLRHDDTAFDATCCCFLQGVVSCAAHVTSAT